MKVCILFVWCSFFLFYRETCYEDLTHLPSFTVIINQFNMVQFCLYLCSMYEPEKQTVKESVARFTKTYILPPKRR